jgi:hypothetical protein
MFGMPNDVEDEPEDKKPAAKDKEDNAPDFSALQSRLDALEARNKSLERANLSLMSTPAPAGTDYTDVKPKEIDFSGMPKIEDDPDGYLAELQKRVKGVVEHNTQAALSGNRRAQSEADKSKELWDDFANTYEDLAGDQKKVGYVAGIVVEKAQKRGVDVQKYVYTNREMFFEDVKDEYEKVFGKAKDKDAETDNDDDDDSRTASVFGGSGSTKGGKSRRQLEPESSFLGDLRTVQEKGGFI